MQSDRPSNCIQTSINIRGFLPRLLKSVKQATMVLADAVCVFLAVIMSVSVCHETESFHNMVRITILYALPLMALFIALFWGFRLYNNIWQYSGLKEAKKLMLCVLIGFCVALVTNELAFLEASWAVLLLSCGFSGVFCGFIRFFPRVSNHMVFFGRTPAVPAPLLLIVGAGVTSAQLIDRMQAGDSRKNCFKAVLVDDDPRKMGKTLHGVPVVGNTSQIPLIIEKYAVSEIYVAIPSLSGKKLDRIKEVGSAAGCTIRKACLPKEVDQTEAPLVKAVNTNDILFREEVQLDIQSIRECFMGKRLLITGGGGSIGSELCRTGGKVRRFKHHYLRCL